jgi:dihydrofolate reductase/thymidylate synthase
MSVLAPFSIIVAIDNTHGMAKNGEIPWNNEEDMKFFRATTMGRQEGKNAVIMGRNTYLSIPDKYRPLAGRRNVIISTTWKQENHPNIRVYPSLVDALAGLGASLSQYNDIFIVGGEMLYKEAINNFMYLCKRIYITRFKTTHSCDQFFPYDRISHYPLANDVLRSTAYNRFVYAPVVKHDEYEYISALKRVIEEGEPKSDRTGVGTVSLFGGISMSFDIRDRLPIITTKRILYDIIIKELIFFISGKTDVRILQDQGINIWNLNTSKQTLSALGLTWNEGDMGPAYPFQWRHFGAEYEGCDKDYDGQGIDQLTGVIKSIRETPHSRRHIISGWNPSQISITPLPPCHGLTIQFNVSGDKKWLDCQVYARSGDMFIGVPFNITSYSILTYAIAHVTNLKPRKLTYVIGDAHIYNNHHEQVKRQIDRTPRPFPTLSLREPHRLHEIDDFTSNSFIIEGYTSWPAISGDLN